VLHANRFFIVVVGSLQLLTGMAWIGWMVFSEEGLPLFLQLIPVVLFVGALASAVTYRLLDENREQAAEIERLKSRKPLDQKLETVRERLEVYGMLRTWGFITEEEFLDKRSALLSLQEPPPVELGSYRSRARTHAGGSKIAGK
jgi:hypothetical protein